MSRFVIVGSGAAGIAAIQSIRELDKNSEIVLVMAEKEGYYSRPGLAYYLNKEIPEAQLFPFSKDDFSQMNLKIIFGIVESVLPETKAISFSDGKTIRYDKLLIAVGAKAVRSSISGTDLDGIIYLDMLSTIKIAIKKAKKAKTAVIVGGGITAIELVEGLIAQKVKVHFLLRKDRFWGNVLDSEESQLVENRLKDEGVVIHYQTEIESISGKKGKVFAIRTKTGEEIPCQIVGFAIGVRPRLHIAEKRGIKSERGILVNEFLETNFPDVYAAGDVAEVYDPHIGKHILDSLWDLARSQGKIAGFNMAGKKKKYIKDVPFNVTRLAGLTTTIIGAIGQKGMDTKAEIVRGESETWQEIPDALVSQYKFDSNRIRLMIGENTIVGALIMGDQTLSEALHQIVNQKIDISTIRDKLLQSQVPLGETLANFWKEWRKENAY